MKEYIHHDHHIYENTEHRIKYKNIQRNRYYNIKYTENTVHTVFKIKIRNKIYLNQ